MLLRYLFFMSAISLSRVLSLRVLSLGEVPDTTGASASQLPNETLAARVAEERLGGPFKKLKKALRKANKRGPPAANKSLRGHRRHEYAPLEYNETFSGEAELSRQNKLTLYRAYMWNMLGALNSSCVVRRPKLKKDKNILDLEHLPKSGAAVFVIDNAFRSSDLSVGRHLIRHDLDDPRILAMASEDWMGPSHPKLTRLPIGLDSKLMTGVRGRATLTQFLHLMENPKAFEARNHTLLSDAHLHVYTHESSKSHNDDRETMIREIDRSVVDDWYDSKIPFTDHLDHVADAKFALCPEGNGLDAHRFYQNYALGTRCIVRDGHLSQMHVEFPGTVIVMSWRDVTAENLAKWSKEKPPAHDGRLLTAEYWIAKVLRKASCGTELVPEL